MRDVLIALIFGFGLSSISLLLCALGILNEKGWLIVIGAILFTPFSYYLFAASGASVIALIPVLMLLGSAVAVYLKKKRWAWVLFAPALLSVLWILGVALYYQYQVQ